MGRRQAVAVAVLICLARSVGAQQASAFDSQVCPSLARGSMTRVEFAAPLPGGTLGPVLTCGRGGLTLDAYAGQPGPQTIDARSINRLWVRRGSGLAGAIWGGIGGGLLGYAIASARTHVCSGPGAPGQSDCHDNIATGIALGAGGGVAIGWFFGRGIPRWHIIYKAMYQ